MTRPELSDTAREAWAAALGGQPDSRMREATAQEVADFETRQRATRKAEALATTHFIDGIAQRRQPVMRKLAVDPNDPDAMIKIDVVSICSSNAKPGDLRDVDDPSRREVYTHRHEWVRADSREHAIALVAESNRVCGTEPERLTYHEGPPRRIDVHQWTEAERVLIAEQRQQPLVFNRIFADKRQKCIYCGDAAPNHASGCVYRPRTAEQAARAIAESDRAIADSYRVVSITCIGCGAPEGALHDPHCPARPKHVGVDFAAGPAPILMSTIGPGSAMRNNSDAAIIVQHIHGDASKLTYEQPPTDAEREQLNSAVRLAASAQSAMEALRASNTNLEQMVAALKTLCLKQEQQLRELKVPGTKVVLARADGVKPAINNVEAHGRTALIIGADS